MRLTFLLLCFLSITTINVYGQLLNRDNSNTPGFNSGNDLEIYYSNLRKKRIGKELPNITFRDSLDKTFDLRSLKGKMVAINVWAFGCKPCIAEMPKLNGLVKKYKNSVRFISILGSLAISRSELKAKHNIDFDYTTLGTYDDIYKLWELKMVFPTHIILDKEGKIIDLFIGGQVESIERILKSNLNQK
jgi:thiol-disulfide isomerase/thioredoxin